MALQIHISVMRSLMPMWSEYEVAHGIKHTSSILVSLQGLVCSSLAVQIASENTQDLGTRLLVFYCTRIKLGSAFYTNNSISLRQIFLIYQIIEILREKGCRIQLYKAVTAR